MKHAPLDIHNKVNSGEKYLNKNDNILRIHTIKKSQLYCYNYNNCVWYGQIPHSIKEYLAQLSDPEMKYNQVIPAPLRDKHGWDKFDQPWGELKPFGFIGWNLWEVPFPCHCPEYKYLLCFLNLIWYM